MYHAIRFPQSYENDFVFTLGQAHLFLQIVWPFLAKTAIIVVLHWVLESGKAGGTPA